MDKKVVCCLTDNAANVTKAIQTIGWMHLPCLAHTINLVVRDALQASKPIIDKVKEAVEYSQKHHGGTKTEGDSTTNEDGGAPTKTGLSYKVEFHLLHVEKLYCQ